MKIIDECDEAESTRQNYGRACKPGTPGHKVHRQLQQIRPYPGADEVNDIAGCHTVSVTCCVCGEREPAVVELTGWYSGQWHEDCVRICQGCLHRAAIELDKHLALRNVLYAAKRKETA